MGFRPDNKDETQVHHISVHNSMMVKNMPMKIDEAWAPARCPTVAAKT